MHLEYTDIAIEKICGSTQSAHIARNAKRSPRDEGISANSKIPAIPSDTLIDTPIDTLRSFIALTRGLHAVMFLGSFRPRVFVSCFDLSF